MKFSSKQEYVLWNTVSVPLLRKQYHYRLTLPRYSLRLPTAAVSGYIDVYYTEKVAQYAQNSEVKGLTHGDFQILRNKCIEVTTLTFQRHVTSSITWPFDSHYVISYGCSVDTFFLSSAVTEIFYSTCQISSQTCIFPLKLAWHEFLLHRGH